MFVLFPLLLLNKVAVKCCCLIAPKPLCIDPDLADRVQVGHKISPAIFTFHPKSAVTQRVGAVNFDRSLFVKCLFFVRFFEFLCNFEFEDSLNIV